MNSNRVIIFGATSAIAAEVGKILANRRAHLFLVGRDAQKLATVAADLTTRGAAAVHTAESDLSESKGHEALYAEAQQKLGGIDTVIIAHGTLGNQKACEADFSLVEKEIRTNFLSPLSLVHVAAKFMEAQKAGTICVISSVAGDRGRQSNYIYGAAKGGLSLALQGVRNRLFHSGVHLVTIKPGFVDTPMTRDVPKGPLFASPQKVAAGIVRAIDKGSDVVYLPFFWFGIMTIIKSIPESIFKRLRL